MAADSVPIAASDASLPPAVTGAAPSQRLMSLDALRGFDMFWILGAGGIFIRIQELVNSDAEPRVAWLKTLAEQLKHKDWEGFAFLDLIFPLFVFMVGVSIVYSLARHLQEQGVARTYLRIVRRFLLLFAMGVIAAGGLTSSWPNVQLSGVLHRIAWCYLFGAILFCHFRPRTIAALVVVLLVGYWALLSYVPFPNVPMPASDGKRIAPDKLPDLSEKFAQAEKISGSYAKGLNLTNYLDAVYLPGRKHSGYYSPEGILSTMTAVATCLLGVLAGCLLRSPAKDWVKVLLLIGLGAAGVGLGFAWGPYFPVVKKIWTSSYVLVAGGYSAILLGLFYLVIDVWKWRWWCLPFVWIGMNAITVYMVRNLVNIREIALRLTGGDVVHAVDAWLGKGWHDVLTSTVAFLLIWWLALFLYRRKVFLRL